MRPTYTIPRPKSLLPPSLSRKTKALENFYNRVEIAVKLKTHPQYLFFYFFFHTFFIYFYLSFLPFSFFESRAIPIRFFSSSSSRSLFLFFFPDFRAHRSVSACSSRSNNSPRKHAPTPEKFAE